MTRLHREAALWDTPGTTETLINQLDRLISFAGLSSVELGVIPHGVPMPIPPLSCFSIYDQDFVLIETLTGEQRLDDPDEVAVYVKAFEQLRDAAATDSAAVEVIHGVAAEVRTARRRHLGHGQRGRDGHPTR